MIRVKYMDVSNGEEWMTIGNYHQSWLVDGLPFCNHRGDQQTWLMVRGRSLFMNRTDNYIWLVISIKYGGCCACGPHGQGLLILDSLRVDESID